MWVPDCPDTQTGFADLWTVPINEMLDIIFFIWALFKLPHRYMGTVRGIGWRCSQLSDGCHRSQFTKSLWTRREVDFLSLKWNQKLCLISLNKEKNIVKTTKVAKQEPLPCIPTYTHSFMSWHESSVFYCSLLVLRRFFLHSSLHFHDHQPRSR